VRSVEPRYYYRRFLHPRFWSTWLLIGLLRLIALLPWGAQQRLGKWFGLAAYRFLKRRRYIAETNIRACFPQLSEQEQAALTRETFISNAKGYMECTVGWWRNLEVYYRKMEVHGLEHLREAERRGKGILLLGGHFSILDFAGPLVNQVLDFNYMYRPHNNPLFNAVIERQRRHFSGRSFDKKQVREMIEFIRAGNLVWYGCDQDFGPDHTVFAPFFGIAAATLTTPAWIARESDATVLFVSQFREQDQVYSIHFSPIFEGYPSECEITNARRLNDQIEAMVRRYPDQYLWLHRRFKTRPEGEPAFYRQ